MTIRLDKTRPFHDVTPPYLGAVYMQGPFYFTEAGDIVEALLDEDAKRKMNTQRLSTPAKPKSEKKDQIVGKQEERKGVPDDIDLAAWAKGEAQYPFFKVNSAAISLWPDDAAACEGDATKLRLLLVDKGVVTLDDLPNMDGDKE